MLLSKNFPVTTQLDADSWNGFLDISRYGYGRPDAVLKKRGFSGAQRVPGADVWRRSETSISLEPDG
jgi:hypothetical protein